MAALCVLLPCVTAARAESLLVDPGPAIEARLWLGRMVSLLEFPRVVCRLDEATDWKIGDPPTRVEIDAATFRPGWHRLAVAAGDQGCAGPQQTVHLLLAPLPLEEAAPGNLTVWFDARNAEFAPARPGQGRLVAVLDGMVAASQPCRDHETCLLDVEAAFWEAFAATPSRAGLLWLPAGADLPVGQPFPPLLGLRAGAVGWSELRLIPERVVFNAPLVAEQALDTASPRHEIEVRFPEALDQVACDVAECRKTATGVRLFQVDPSAGRVRLNYTLRPRFFLQRDRRLLRADSVVLRLERCAIQAPLEVPLLSGTLNHRLFIKIPADCLSATEPVEERLALRTRPAVRAFLRAEHPAADPAVRLLEVQLERVPVGVEQLTLTLLERSGGARRLGAVNLPVVSAFEPGRIRLEVPAVGPVEFIPNNRPARLLLAFDDDRFSSDLTVEDRPGWYRSSRDADGWSVQGEPGSAGVVPLRLAYRPRALNAFLGRAADEPVPELALFDTQARFEVRTLNLVVPLVPERSPTGPVIEVECGPPGHARTLIPGSLNRIPFSQRDSCRLVFHLARLPPDAGLQRLRVQAGEFNQVITLAPGPGELLASIPPGERNEYDQLTVSVAHDLLSGHYTLLPRQSLGQDLRYRILLSDRSFRISATTALPTGLFRFSEKEITGAVPVSAGALGRVLYIQASGREFPLGLEMGLFATNLSNTPDFSIVIGLGLNLPVLNQNTALQASFNLHAWAEYAPTRLSRDLTPFAFLFGPSFSVGMISTNF
ncbi:MAG: hypothetical protein GYA21_05435 [Myxococcales bacterium]|nr:hypothetical protein [Myxococcales bacterium]